MFPLPGFFQDQFPCTYLDGVYKIFINMNVGIKLGRTPDLAQIQAIGIFPTDHSLPLK